METERSSRPSNIRGEFERLLASVQVQPDSQGYRKSRDDIEIDGRNYAVAHTVTTGRFGRPHDRRETFSIFVTEQDARHTYVYDALNGILFIGHQPVTDPEAYERFYGEIEKLKDAGLKDEAS